jgi:hypothetical protein
MGAVLGLAIPALVGAAICAATRIELAVFLLVICGVLVAPSGLMAGIPLVPIMGRLVTVTRLPLICIPAMCGTAIGYVSFLSYLAALCCLARPSVRGVVALLAAAATIIAATLPVPRFDVVPIGVLLVVFVIVAPKGIIGWFRR